MIPAWYLRMNQRERLLAVSVAGIVFLLINLWIWSALFGMAAKAHAAFSARRTARAEQIIYLKEYKTWANREKWLEKTQPVSKGEVDASTLLDQVKQVASKHAILLENPAIGFVQREDRHVIARARHQPRDGGDAVRSGQVRREDDDRHVYNSPA